MTGAFAAVIEVLGVPGELFAHDSGDAVFAAFEKDMDVVVHEAPGIDRTLPFCNIFSQSLQKKLCPGGLRIYWFDQCRAP